MLIEKYQAVFRLTTRLSSQERTSFNLGSIVVCLQRLIQSLHKRCPQSKDNEYILDELAEIQANYEYEKDIGEEGWRGCFAGGWRRNSNLRKILIGTMLQFWQQWTGINFIFCECP